MEFDIDKDGYGLIKKYDKEIILSPEELIQLKNLLNTQTLKEKHTNGIILNHLIYDHIIDLTNFFMEKYLNNEIKDIKQVCDNIMNRNNNIFSMDIQFNHDINIAHCKVQLKNNIEYFTFNIDFN